MDWIAAIWLRVAKLIEEKGGLRFWKGGPTIKMKYLITKKKKNWTWGQGGASLGGDQTPNLLFDYKILY